MTSTSTAERTGASRPANRRDELADALFAYIGGLKRRLMASVAPLRKLRG